MTRSAVAAVLVVLATALTSCGDSPDLAACEKAMRAQIAAAAANPDGPEGTKPPECEGISDAELERLGEKVLSDTLGGTPSPAP